MSAMLTYFDFMLQKIRYGRKDSAQTPYPAPSDGFRPACEPVIPGVAGRRKVLEVTLKLRHHSGEIGR
jgi:hypothetical protein